MTKRRTTYVNQAGPNRALLAVAAVALTGALCCAFGTSAPPFAHAQEAYEEIQMAQEAVKHAQSAFDEVEVEAKALEARVAEIEAVMPAQQQRSDQAIRNLYKMQNNRFSTLDVLLGSQTLDEFILQAEYLQRITKTNLDTINTTKQLRTELAKSEERVATLRNEAQGRLDETTAALEALEDERVKKQREGIERAQSQVTGSSSNDFVSATATGGSNGEGGESGSSASAGATVNAEQASDLHEQASSSVSALDDGADWHMSEDEFVAEWAPRIDAYLAGSPMAGTGEYFARSSWKYCVDPRWSPAISNIESGKGAICIRPHNAWGWGAADSDPYNLASEWSSWEEAIDAHVKGLANGYGYTITLAGARAYCPPNWQTWYNTTVSQMASI